MKNHNFTKRESGRISRFKSAKVDPSKSYGLKPDHPAVLEGRTLFPRSVTASIDSPRFLVSGKNNAKLGEHVVGGARDGWPIFQLSLEERATCPRSCAQWLNCYGNGMHMARRHRVDEHFYGLMRAELTMLAREHRDGFLVRLHTLGDFPNPQYVRFWADMLDLFEPLHIFGFTARDEEADDAESRRTAMAIAWLANQAWDRFSIRFSRSTSVPQGAVVSDKPISGPQVIMCPAQTEKTTACATCGLCWAPAARMKTIGFLRHGMKRRGSQAPEKEPKAMRPPPEKRQASARSSERERRVLAALRRAADADGYVTIPLSQLSAESGVRQTTLRQDLDALLFDKLILEEHTGHGQMPSTYRLSLSGADGVLEAAPDPPALDHAAPKPWIEVARERLSKFDPCLRKPPEN